MVRIRPSWLGSVVYNTLVRTQRTEHWYVFGRAWTRLWKDSRRCFTDPIETRIHGRLVIANFGYTYPLFARRFEQFNAPLVQVVFEAFRARVRPVIVVDVGAAIGDTVILIKANCPAMVSAFVCVEGDGEFYEYLVTNLAKEKDVYLAKALLSSEPGIERELIRTHAGTASAQGEIREGSVTLDSVIGKVAFDGVDVLKIDVDGLDGKILAGASNLLKQDRPIVIFEWHPILYAATGNGCGVPFSILSAAGYDRFVWFSKFGTFSHFTESGNLEANDWLADLCKRSRHAYDWHYDVVALHKDDDIAVLDLAELGFAKSRVSRY